MGESEVFSADSGVIVAAHELKAPLSLVRQLALSLEFAKNLEQSKKVGERIVATSERALRQVEDLTRLARLEDGLFTMEPINPRVICDDVLSELWHLFEFNRRELRVRYKNKNRLVFSNRQMLYSVIYNFCLNAMNYGGEDCPSEIIVRDYDRSRKVRVEVRDFGPTIPTKVWREIKNGGAERPVEISMRPGSSGLGLYIAARFARYMESNFGVVRHKDGTSFYIDLPVSGQLSLV